MKKKTDVSAVEETMTPAMKAQMAKIKNGSSSSGKRVVNRNKAVKCDMTVQTSPALAVKCDMAVQTSPALIGPKHNISDDNIQSVKMEKKKDVSVVEETMTPAMKAQMAKIKDGSSSSGKRVVKGNKAVKCYMAVQTSPALIAPKHKISDDNIQSVEMEEKKDVSVVEEMMTPVMKAQMAKIKNGSSSSGKRVVKGNKAVKCYMAVQTSPALAVKCDMAVQTSPALIAPKHNISDDNIQSVEMEKKKDVSVVEETMTPAMKTQMAKIKNGSSSSGKRVVKGNKAVKCYMAVQTSPALAVKCDMAVQTSPALIAPKHKISDDNIQSVKMEKKKDVSVVEETMTPAMKAQMAKIKNNSSSSGKRVVKGNKAVKCYMAVQTSPAFTRKRKTASPALVRKRKTAI